MDPNVNLEEQRRLAMRILRDAADPDASPDASRLAELVLALDEWLSKGAHAALIGILEGLATALARKAGLRP